MNTREYEPEGQDVGPNDELSLSLGMAIVKKKRKSPAVPWKKPADMPKRPLSAYNLYFQAERKRLIARTEHGGASAGPSGGLGKGKGDDVDVPGETPLSLSAESRKHLKTSGLGFANLAKTIAESWRQLLPWEKAPYEVQAAKDKVRYDVDVAKWRKEKKSREAKKALLESDAAAQSSSQVMNSALLVPYPAEWFDIADETSRTFDESFTTFESSQRSLDRSLGHGVNVVPPFLHQPQFLSPFESYPSAHSSVHGGVAYHPNTNVMLGTESLQTRNPQHFWNAAPSRMQNVGRVVEYVPGLTDTAGRQPPPSYTDVPMGLFSDVGAQTPGGERLSGPFDEQWARGSAFVEHWAHGSFTPNPFNPNPFDYGAQFQQPDVNFHGNYGSSDWPPPNAIVHGHVPVGVAAPMGFLHAPSGPPRMPALYRPTQPSLANIQSGNLSSRQRFLPLTSPASANTGNNPNVETPPRTSAQSRDLGGAQEQECLDDESITFITEARFP